MSKLSNPSRNVNQFIYDFSMYNYSNKEFKTRTIEKVKKITQNTISDDRIKEIQLEMLWNKITKEKKLYDNQQIKKTTSNPIPTLNYSKQHNHENINRYLNIIDFDLQQTFLKYGFECCYYNNVVSLKSCNHTINPITINGDNPTHKSEKLKRAFKLFTYKSNYTGTIEQKESLQKIVNFMWLTQVNINKIPPKYIQHLKKEKRENKSYSDISASVENN